MRTNRLGCLTGTGMIAALITVFVIAGFVYAKGGLLYNPGPLSAHGDEMETLGGVRSHAEIGGNCKACHTAPWESAKMADRCSTCHSVIASQMMDVASMHGKMEHDNPDLTCHHCHPDHRGPDAQLTVMDSGLFPHEVVGFVLTGHQRTTANTPFTCDDCHHGDITVFAADSCQTCHRQMDIPFAQAHLLAFGADCLACHDGADRYGDDFNHNTFSFQLTGKHATVNCTECHLDARTVADLQSVTQDCLSCHRKDEPHEGRFGMNCADCHSAEGWTPAKFDHNLAAFKLEGEHAEAQCEECHQDGVYKGTPADCYSCHKQDDEHDGKFGTDCAACHTPTDWEDATFDHNKSNFPLTGRHVGLACEQCHSSGTFAGLSTACITCHSDPGYHAGLFGTNCVQCHTTQNWYAPYTGGHPGIADEGGSGVNHGGGTCRDCHTRSLHSATCTACHDSNNPDDDGGGDGGGDD
jgi:hypothetical protein